MIRFIEIEGVNGTKIAINVSKIIELVNTNDGHCEFVLEGNWHEKSKDSYESIKKKIRGCLH